MWVEGSLAKALERSRRKRKAAKKTAETEVEIKKGFPHPFCKWFHMKSSALKSQWRSIKYVCNISEVEVA